MNKAIKDCYATLQKHQHNIEPYSLRRLFEDNPKRVEQFSLTMNGLYLDYSKNHITHETLNHLSDLAKQRQLPQAIKALMGGKPVNNTENRPALHTALRFQGKAQTEQEKLVEQTRHKMASFVQAIHSGQHTGFSQKAITTVINIGIGGSDLGPRMVVEALSAYKQSVDVKFVANIDGADLSDTLDTINPETTLFIIASKSFTTLETLENGKSARRWILDNGCPEQDLHKHFIAISTNISAAKIFGISSDNIFPMWDWVGGRYSLWSAIGLPIAIAIGMNNFNDLLLGAHQMDEHYRNTDLQQNLPVVAALISFWYGQFWQTNAHAVLPYAQRLNRLPAYLQQLDMESLGKSVSKQGTPVDYSTGHIIWGTEGSNGQHSFYQLLHQGTQLIPVDFIAIKHSMSALKHQHKMLQACCISQSQALMKGKTLADAEKELLEQGVDPSVAKSLAPHKVVGGNKPSNTIVMDTLNPINLGALIAFYEHKVYTLGALLNVNPFDQWGVELGKQLGQPICEALNHNTIDDHWDESTRSLIKKLLTD